jgi:hypothetical protein
MSFHYCQLWDETKHVAYEANALGRFDAVIHNAGVYRAPPKEIFMVNTIAPYILTCLIGKPQRLTYLSSSLHLQGRANLENFKKDSSRINYSDSKLGVAVGAIFFFQMIGLVVAPSILRLAQNSAIDLESGLKLVFLIGAVAMAIALLMIITIPEISMEAESAEKTRHP